METLAQDAVHLVSNCRVVSAGSADPPCSEVHDIRMVADDRDLILGGLRFTHAGVLGNADTAAGLRHAS
jgi:hypothetical protein